MALAELNSSQVHQVHAVQVVVYEELQQVGDVTLMGLITLVHHCSTLQQLTHSVTNKIIQLNIYIYFFFFYNHKSEKVGKVCSAPSQFF